jgi:hypothetical protein
MANCIMMLTIANFMSLARRIGSILGRIGEGGGHAVMGLALWVNVIKRDRSVHIMCFLLPACRIGPARLML